jgi:large subunit ribosomal protein L10
MPNPQKVEKVAEIKKLFNDAHSFFVTDYQGLNVADITALRRHLRDNNIMYLVAKNTLLQLAATEAGVPDISKHLTGATAVAFTKDDAAVAAKILHDSFKDKDLPRMKVFVVDRQAFGGDEISRLADLPSKDVLLAHVVLAVEGPMRELVGTIDTIFRDLVGTIEALAEKTKNEA